MKPHDSTGLINFSVIVSNFVNVLKEYKHIGDLQSSSTLYMAVDKLPQVLKKNGGSTSMTRARNGLILSCLKNGYHEWRSCMKVSQRLKGNTKKKTDATQIEKNDSRRRRTSVQVQTCKKPSKCKTTTVH